jgi:threonine synthase
MDNVEGLVCVGCGKQWSVEQTLYTCPGCGENLDVVYNYGGIKKRLSVDRLKRCRDWSMWRYRPVLPVKPRSPLPPLQVGWTPLYQAKDLAASLGLRELSIKDEGRNPTASLKDRASAVGVVKAWELGFNTITCASTGNAASSLAGLSASVGLPNVIFVPERAPKAKVAQLLVFGSQVLMVRGTYDQAFDLCLEASARFNWYSRNTGYNPYLSEGKKTAALEVCEQLGFRVPDKVFVSVGDGCIIGGLWKGFRDAHALGWIDGLPQLVGVQAQGSAPLVKAWQSGKPVEPLVPDTIADSIAVGMPRDALKALRAVRESKGQMVAVSDAEILEAMRVLGRQAAVFGEPAGVTGFAGLLKLLGAGAVRPDERVVVLVTGNGLKDAESAIRAGGEPTLIEATVEGMTAALGRLGLA